MDLWYRINKDFPDYKLHLIPFEDNHEGILSEIKKPGIKFDFLIGVCDSKTWLSMCNVLPLGKYKNLWKQQKNYSNNEYQTISLLNIVTPVTSIVKATGLA